MWEKAHRAVGFRRRGAGGGAVVKQAAAAAAAGADPPPYAPLSYDWIYSGVGSCSSASEDASMPPLVISAVAVNTDSPPTVPLIGGQQQQEQQQQQDEEEEEEDEQQQDDQEENHHEVKTKLKCVLVGDGAVGKTSLVVSYTTNGYPTEYVPTAFDNYNVVVNVDGQPIRLQLCDTAGQDDFDSLRPLCYPGSDVFLVCFSVVSPTSFHNVRDKWLPELRLHNPSVPILLVGTQSDLRTDVKVLIELAQYREQPVSESGAWKLAHQMGAIGYVESSALTQKNLKEVFDQAIVAALDSRSPLRRKNGASGKRRGTLDMHVGADQAVDYGDDRRSKSGWRKFCCFS